MLQIQSLTNDTLQVMSITLADGTSVDMTIYFVPMQLGWFITNLSYNNVTIQGMRIVNSPNMLQQFANQLPFGLACISTDNREPSLQQDFSSGASILYILNATEVAQFTAYLDGE